MRKLFSRLLGLILVCLITLVGFYGSLVFSASPLAVEERIQIDRAILELKGRGFTDEAFLLEHLVVFRSNDNWLNASVEKENAFAATNFPFGIVTLYPDFFSVTTDSTDRAAILLHEVRHVLGDDERAAYEFVWRNRNKLGWTAETHGATETWAIIKKQTKDFAPQLFICELNIESDCTAGPRLPSK